MVKSNILATLGLVYVVDVYQKGNLDCLPLKESNIAFFSTYKWYAKKPLNLNVRKMSLSQTQRKVNILMKSLLMQNIHRARNEWISYGEKYVNEVPEWNVENDWISYQNF